MVTFVGGSPETPRSSPCWEGYRAEVEESAASVRVTVQRLSPPPVSRPAEEVAFGCAGIGHFRTLDVPLRDPLGARALLDGADGQAKPVLDGGRVLVPDRLADGWALNREEPRTSLMGDLQERVEWAQWYGPRPATDGRCLATEHAFLLTTAPGPSPVPPGPRAAGKTLLGAPMVRGYPAELVHESDQDQVVLSWDEPQASYAIRTMRACANGSRPDPAAVVAFGRSLRLPD